MAAGRSARRGRQILTVIAGCLLAFGLAACAAIYLDHGYVPEEVELATIEVGKDTRESVAEKIGRPSAAGLLNDLGWYYVRSRWEHKGARAPKEIDRQVVAVSFTEEGVVSNVERFGLERGKVVVLSRRVTDSNVKGMGLIRQLMGNLGRMRATDIVD